MLALPNRWWHSWCAALAAAAIAAFAIAGTRPAKAAETRVLCREAAARVEATLGIPAQLLGAIALTESGRWDGARQANFAWPWTVYADGRVRYLRDKARAIAEVEHLRAHGVRNIDIGCMQVNLFYHPKAFASLEEGFDPEVNATYAGRFLRRLKDETRSWNKSIARYHSSTPKFAVPYHRKVKRLWRSERRRVALAKRNALIADYDRRRASASTTAADATATD